MIVFSCIRNRGGMKRVADLLLAHSKTLPFKVIVYSAEKPANLGDNFWVPWGDFPNLLAPVAIEHYQRKTRDILGHVTPKAIVGDFFTLPYFDGLPGKKIFDAHLLHRPLHRCLQKFPVPREFTELLRVPLELQVQVYSFGFLPYEKSLMAKADGFIAYSENSVADLRLSYEYETAGKPVHRLFLMSADADAGTSDGDYLYAFSRLHWQKGIHLLLRTWETPLLIRGVDDKVLKPNARESLRRRNILLGDWEANDRVLTDEMSRARACLFPSLYEPWGLALTEAMAHGKLVIANRNLSGHEEQIDDGVNGFLRDFGRADLVEEVQRILGRPAEELRKITLAAQVKARGYREKSLLSYCHFLEQYR